MCLPSPGTPSHTLLAKTSADAPSAHWSASADTVEHRDSHVHRCDRADSQGSPATYTGADSEGLQGTLTSADSRTRKHVDECGLVRLASHVDENVLMFLHRCFPNFPVVLHASTSLTSLWRPTMRLKGSLPRLSHGRKQQNCGFRRAGKIDLRIRFHLHVEDVRPGQGASLSSELGVLRERCAWAGCALRWVRVWCAPTNVLPLGGLTTENLSISHLFGRSC